MPPAVNYAALVVLEIGVVAMGVNEGIDAAAVFALGLLLAGLLGFSLGRE